jgi:hypothetical protein
VREPPNLDVVNRVLGESLRKSEEAVKKLRGELLIAAGALQVAGYHTSAERAYRTWEETAV